VVCRDQVLFADFTKNGVNGAYTLAGHETTTRLIGSCLMLLFQNPDQFAEVRADRSLLSNAIEETLRLDPPVLALSRQVAEDFDYQGHVLRKGR
jgi:pimeloyl-[acyl-carrier protein] synthase